MLRQSREVEKWKISYCVRERKVNGEAGEVAEYAIVTWMERLGELTRGYELLISGIWTKQAVFFEGTATEKSC